MPSIPWYTGGPEMLGRAERKRRQMDALSTLANLGGRTISAVRARESDEEKTKRDELELETRLGKQQQDVVQSAKSERERQTEPPADQALQVRETDTGEAPLSPEQQRGSLASILGRATTPLRRMILGDPGQAGRLRHIAQMKGLTERYGDIGKRLHAAEGFAKYSPDPGAMVKGVGGEELGIPTTGMRQPPASAKGGAYAAHMEAAREALKAAHGNDPSYEPSVREVTEKVDQQATEADRRKFETHKSIESKYAKPRATQPKTIAGYRDETTGEEIPTPLKEDFNALAEFNADVARRRAQNHRLRRVLIDVTPGAGGGPGGGDEPAGGAGEAPFVDHESGINFGTVGP